MTLLDCFAGSGTMLLAGLDFGASRVIGIEKQKKLDAVSEKALKLLDRYTEEEPPQTIHFEDAKKPS